MQKLQFLIAPYIFVTVIIPTKSREMKGMMHTCTNKCQPSDELTLSAQVDQFVPSRASPFGYATAVRSPHKAHGDVDAQRVRSSYPPASHEGI